MIYKTLNNKEMLKLCRKYDKDMTSKRDDEYLLRLFEDYIRVLNNKNISIDTSKDSRREAEIDMEKCKKET